MTEALDAFCKRYIEGSEVDPTGNRWDSTLPLVKNVVRDTFIGPLHHAAQVLTKPRTVTTVEALDALPVGSVVLDAEGKPLMNDGDRSEQWLRSEGVAHPAWLSSQEISMPATVLHVGGDR
jgi:hypothetical protein